MSTNQKEIIDNGLNGADFNGTGFKGTDSNANDNNDLHGTDEPAPMQTQESIKIVQKLFDGINPLSDEPLPSNSFYLDADIKRALDKALTALARLDNYEQRQAKLPSNAGKPWTEEQDTELLAAFDIEQDLKVLAEQHGRTKGAIRSRLLKLGKIVE